MRSILVFFASVALIFSQVQADVDDSKPDLGRFKLRRVSTAELARQRSTGEVRDPSTGAKFMHESLFTDSLYVVCPAHEHLFRLIENQNRKSDANGTPSAIRQDVIEMLAVVVTSDRILYNRLLRKNVISGEAARHFLQAAKNLEIELADRDTWLELVHCMQAYMGGQELVTSYLSDPKRATLLASLNTFKALPVDDEHAVVREKPPHQLVSRLAQRFDGGRPKLALEAAQLEAGLLRQASQVIEDLDDDETADERRKAKNEEVAGDAAISPQDTDAQLEQIQEREVAKVIENPVTSEDVPVDVELILPQNNEVIEEKLVEKDVCDIANLNVMKFIKLRLLKGGEPPLSMQNAYDFHVHWYDLENTNIDGSAPLSHECEDFRDAPSSIMVAERVAKVIASYIEMGDLFATIKDKQLRSLIAKTGRQPPPMGLGEGWTSMDEFRGFFTRLTELMEELDPAFDMDDMKRYYTSWKKVYVEYDTMDKFIEGSLW